MRRPLLLLPAALCACAPSPETGPYDLSVFSRREPVFIRLHETTEALASGEIQASAGEGQATLYPDDSRLVLWPPETHWPQNIPWGIDGAEHKPNTRALYLDEGAYLRGPSWRFHTVEGVGLRGSPFGQTLLVELSVSEDRGTLSLYQSGETGCPVLLAETPVTQVFGAWLGQAPASLAFDDGAFQATSINLSVGPEQMPRLWAPGNWTGPYAASSCALLGDWGTNCEGGVASGVLFGFHPEQVEAIPCL